LEAASSEYSNSHRVNVMKLKTKFNETMMNDVLYTGSTRVMRRRRRSRRCPEHHESPNTPVTANLTQAAATVDGAYIENLKSARAKPLTNKLWAQPAGCHQISIWRSKVKGQTRRLLFDLKTN